MFNNNAKHIVVIVFEQFWLVKLIVNKLIVDKKLNAISIYKHGIIFVQYFVKIIIRY